MLKDNFTPSTHAFDIIVDVDGEGHYTDIQSAINAASAGESIFVKKGTYMTTSVISVNKKLSLWGASRDGVIVRIGANNINGIEITSERAEIHNLQVDGNKSNYTGMSYAGIYINRVNNCLIDNCYVQNCDKDGIHLMDSDKNIIIGSICTSNILNGINCSRCSFFNIIKDNICISNGYDGIRLIDGGYYNKIVGNTCTSNSRNGIATTDICLGNIISENICNDSLRCGIALHGYAERSIVSNNVCYDNVQHGIVVEERSSRNTITGNKCWDNDKNDTASYDGIFVEYDSHNNIISLNECWDNDRWEINISDASCDQNHVVHNNVNGTKHVGTIMDMGTNTLIKDNIGYNPVGTSAIAVGGSPFTYTAGATHESVYMSGGNVTSITKNGNNLGLTSGTFELEPHDNIAVTYIAAPTMWRDIH